MNDRQSTRIRILGLAALVSVLAATPAKATTPFTGAVDAFTRKLADLGAALGETPAVGAWLTAQVSDPVRIELWTSLAAHLAFAIVGGMVLAFLARFALGSTIRRIESQHAPTWWVRIPMAVGRFLLVALPAGLFAAAGTVALTFFEPAEAVRHAALTALAAITAAWLAVALTRAVLAPFVPELRPVPLEDGSAAFLFVWSRRLINFLAFSFFMIGVTRILEAPEAGSLLLTKLLGLIFGLLVVALILQVRTDVAGWIAGEADGSPGWRLFRERIGDIWHIVAILYITAGWGVWALEIPGGFEFFAGNTAATAVILALAWIASWGSGRGLQRLFGVGKEIRSQYPFVAERANLYLPAVRRVLTIVIQIVAAIAILRVWGLDLSSLTGSDLGRVLVGRGLSIVIIIGVALLVWEVASGAIRI